MNANAPSSYHMTMEHETSRRLDRRALLPWALASAGLILYLITLNTWVTFQSLPHVAKLAGWTWHVERTAPLYWTLTYPFKWLSAAQIPFVLNLLAAVCGALTLGLLARSVMLLPHDRTLAQRERERSSHALLSIPLAWVPPVLAVIVCGLQITFWENATSARTAPPISASAQILDLLMFAYIVRCLLEYRIEENDRWLFKAACAYGLAMTNDWAMLSYLPLFIAALIWIKGVGFFGGQFLTRLIGCGLAGLSLYLLLPIAQSFSSIHAMGFWPTLRTNIGEQIYLVKSSYTVLNRALMVFSFTSLVPVFLIGIRWTSYFGDTSRTGAIAARLVFHLVHALFLGACVWMAFDPPVSPRNRNSVAPFLSLYYLGALAVGYYSGYFLLVFGGKRSSRTSRVTPPGPLDLVVKWSVMSLLVLVPAGLLMLNAPRIRIANGPLLKEHARQLAQHLPSKGGVLFSDDPRRSVLLQAWFAGKPESTAFLFLETGSLPIPEYHKYLARHYKERWGWNIATPKELVSDSKLVELAYNLSLTNEIHYLHPSFGYYFELFYAEPHGLTSQLKFFPDGSLLPPKLPEAVIKENEAFWASANLEPLQRHIEGPVGDTGLRMRILSKLRLKHEVNGDARIAGGYYAQSLNAWGAELQRHDDFAKAGLRFKTAEELNPDNVVAKANAEFNARYQAGDRNAAYTPRRLDEEFGRYRTWQDVIASNGPFDEPVFCYNLGLAYVQGKILRQAARNFERARTLAPNNVMAHLWLGAMLSRGSKPAQTLELVREIYANPEIAQHNTNRSELLMLEATAYLEMTNNAAAAEAARKALERWPGDDNLQRSAFDIFLRARAHTNALSIVNGWLKENPDDPSALVNKGFISIQLGHFSDAIAPLTKAVELAKNDASVYNQALFNRAVANLRLGELAAAKQDYTALTAVYTNSYQLHYGLAEIAYQSKDTPAAILHYEQYLAGSPQDPAETIEKAKRRLEELKAGPR